MPVSFSPIDRARVNIGTSLNINFTNTIDASSFDTTTMLKIDPPIPGAQIQVNIKHIYMSYSIYYFVLDEW